MQSLALAAVMIFCSKGSMNSGFNLKITKQGVVASVKGKSCEMSYVDYNPVSPRYEGWSRVSPNTECAEFAALVVGRKGISGEPLNIHWLSLSPEVMSGAHGFAQLGFENDWDPGAGGTAKSNMRCFPK